MVNNNSRHHEPLVSVIVPLFNSSSFVHRLIDSLKNQTYKLFEVILVDDGSTDNTLRALKGEVLNDRRFRIFHKLNEGQALARRFGIQKSIGSLITFVDGDDCVMNNHIETLVNLISQYNASVSMVNAWRVSNGAKIGKEIHGLSSGVEDNRQFRQNWISGKIPGFLWNKMFRRELLLPDDFYDENNFMEDVRLISKLADRIHVFAFSDECTYLYQQRPDSSVHRNFGTDDWLAMRKTMSLLQGLIRFPEDSNAWQKRYVSSFYFMLQGTAFDSYCENQALIINIIGNSKVDWPNHVNAKERFVFRMAKTKTSFLIVRFLDALAHCGRNLIHSL
ncbi:glycosyltransferase family 2 protein [Lacticaseibacillus zhaodongensis]|uniref:glycosyltransferase family 2 protein n=1 Tax=Lacticaseibacillus zhaodongensis TaxID=2668065 RepID=UPI0018AF86CD|nr:glycosyltransferase family 2 protein [Lacticaseibacillus zhaodongensis]